MKKLVALSMTLALALSLTACGGGSSSTTATTGGGGASTTAASKDSGADTTAASQDDKSGTPDAAPAGDVVVMTLASNHTQDFVTSLACKHFAEQVEEKTGGAVKIECYFDAVLGEETATLEQCQYGGIDFILLSNEMTPVSRREVFIIACMRKSSFSSWPPEACKNSLCFSSGIGCSSKVAFTIFRLLIGVFT